MPRNRIKKFPVIIRFLFAIAVIIMVFIASITFKHIGDLSDSYDLVTNTYKVNLELEQIISHLKDAETGNRGYTITKDSIYLTPFIQAREKVNNSFVILKKLTKENEVQQKNLKQLYLYINKRFVNFSKTQLMVERNQIRNKAFFDTFKEGKICMDEIRTQVNKMIAIENELLVEREHINNDYIKTTPNFIYLLLIFTLGLIAMAYYKVNTDFNKIKHKNNQLSIFQELSNQAEIVSKSGSWFRDLETQNYHFSDNLYRLLGEEPQSFEATNENFTKYIHPEDIEFVRGEGDKMRESNRLDDLQYRLITKQGEVKYVRAFGRVMQDSSGNEKFIGTITDITVEHESFHSLEEKNQELEQNNKELSAFNYVASHDLQEPLRKIQTFISRLEDKELEHFSDTGKQYFERIKSAASRMRLLIDDLLQFSRTNKAEKVFELSNLNDLLENAKQDVAEIINEKKAEITSDELPTLEVIPFQIQQLFLNLISNSLKYSKKDEKPIIKITHQKVKAADVEELNSNSRDQFHKITFTDNGIGFDQEYAERIFVLFSRLHEKDEYSGTGIGLSICKKIIENHKGYIFALGKPNEGAVFTMYLPA